MAQCLLQTAPPLAPGSYETLKVMFTTEYVKHVSGIVFDRVSIFSNQRRIVTGVTALNARLGA